MSKSANTKRKRVFSLVTATACALGALNGVSALAETGDASPVGSASTASDSTDQKIKKLEDRVEELELTKALNRFQFSGTMINRYEMYDARYTASDGSTTRQSIRAPITYVGLNIDANISQNLKFYSTLSFAKFWQQENRNESWSYWSNSETGSFNLSGSQAKFDRAYAAYTFTGIPLTVAAGRMATNMGEPINQLDGLPRTGTYPRLAYNSIFDGIALIYDFSSLLPTNNSLVFRTFYQPFSNVSPADRKQQLTDTDASGNVVQIDSSTPQFTFLLEYAHDNWAWLHRLSADLFYYQYMRFYNDGQNATNTGSNNPNNQPFNENARAVGVYVGLEDIAKTGINFDVNGLFVKSSYYLLNDNQINSEAWLFNVNRKFDSLHGLVLGGEYIHTDPNYYLDEWTTLNVIPFYQNPNSHGYHVYGSMPVADHVIARIGYYYLKQEPYSTPNIATYKDFDVRFHALYTQVRIDF